ncbi:cinnamoyl-CoA reductase 1-like [Senna tora]|uniref:Cinnamoyl-CoA reductase 1-like n=1 Tax=Senna tora TaxID=362788 RepID=A0A835C8Y4_9FABA|nr:cinnamoyl-CoA reductase 1-like [Senna tora]
MAIGEGKVVCVTGANGYIASWIVKFLLLRGYTVKATVRDPNDPKKVEHLVKLEGAKERLKLMKADLLQEGSFDSAIEDCEGVFHTASPCINNSKSELIDPAVNGTLNVLKSCAKSSCVRRVVLTSSMAAVQCKRGPKTNETLVDEAWFSDPQFCTQAKLWYNLSKTLGEEAAWKFAKENNIDLVSINPATAIGPLLQPILNESVEVVLNLINGGKTFPNYCRGWVNVKDVANAHIQAFEISSANGRYCVVESVEHYSEVIKILRKSFPSLQLPERCADDKPPMPKHQVSKERAKSLGIEFIPLDVCLKETLESLKEKKFLNF